MGAPKIGWENFFRTGTISASSEASGFEKENAYDWNTYDYWSPTDVTNEWIKVDMGTAQAADYFAVAAHNLNDYSGSIKCQYSSDDFASDVHDASTLVTPADNAPFFEEFTSVSARYWRLLINSTTTAPRLGCISLGTALEMDRAVGAGFAIPFDARNDMVINQRSEGGQFLGRSVIRKGVSTSMTFTLQTLAFVRGDWRNFLDHAQLYPWFFTWNPTYGDALLLWLEGDPTPPVYNTHTLLNVGVTVRGLRN